MKKLGLMLALALLVLPVAAQAGTITLSNLKGTWSDGNPAANVTYVGNGTAFASANWGGVTPPSGYDFAAAAPPPIVLPPSPSAAFDIGTFTHRNEPIPGGTSITDIRLTLGVDVTVDAVFLGTKFFVFDFKHNETPNGADPCANGGANGVGVNINGCADSVQFIYNALSDSFNVGGVLYTLNLSGFQVGGSTVTEFWTKEVADNSAILRASVVERSSVVPEPGSTLVLLGLGLVGLGVWRRRR